MDSPKSFRKPRCCECGEELPPRAVPYEGNTLRLYCDHCRPVKRVKDTWKPMTAGSFAGMYIVPDRNRRH